MNYKKEEILKSITKCLDAEKDNKKRNSMGVLESFYNSYYLVGKCFTATELNKMSEVELNNLVTLADFASEIFY